MKPFLDENFLLESETARLLYHTYAKDLPILDYHNHLPPDQIAQNHVFGSITEAWLYGDHYKWRAMRTQGVAERYCTGDAPDEEKFAQWAYTVPYTLRNPLYHWTHLELQRYFQIHTLLSPTTADAIYRETSAQLRQSSYGARGLLESRGVEVVCTTDDPLDSLEHHLAYQKQGHALQMLPTFRPDKFLQINHASYPTFIEKLAHITQTSITQLPDLIQALNLRIDFFHSLGGRLSDHGLEFIPIGVVDTELANQTFQAALEGKAISKEENAQFQVTLLHQLGKKYSEMNWTQQFHLGALRNNNPYALRALGPDTGWDSIGDFPQAVGLSRFLGRLADENALAKTILYNLNPADNAVFATMIGNFNDGHLAGKIQYGSGWWFLDQKDGMEKQLNALSNMGLLSRFIGMLTDSRSFLSFPRHEYFRRILCNLLGNDIEKGELPADIPWTGKIIQDICYLNAKDYFQFTS